MRFTLPGSFAALLPLSALLFLQGCAGTPAVPERAAGPPGRPVIALTAKSYSFTPETVLARAGDELTLEVDNISGSDHNITIETPSGRTLRSLDLPAREKITVKIRLKEAGTYPFYCEQPYHSTLGMHGSIRAE